MVDSPNIAHFFVTALQQGGVVTNPETGRQQSSMAVAIRSYHRMDRFRIR